MINTRCQLKCGTPDCYDEAAFGIRNCGGHCVSPSDVHRKAAGIRRKDGGIPPEVGLYGDADTFPQYIRYSAGTSIAKTISDFQNLHVARKLKEKSQ